MPLRGCANLRSVTPRLGQFLYPAPSQAILESKRRSASSRERSGRMRFVTERGAPVTPLPKQREDSLGKSLSVFAAPARGLFRKRFSRSETLAGLSSVRNFYVGRSRAARSTDRHRTDIELATPSRSHLAPIRYDVDTSKSSDALHQRLISRQLAARKLGTEIAQGVVHGGA